MELRDLALLILSSPHAEDKLFFPSSFTDHHPGAPYYWDEPARAPHLRLRRRTREGKLPSFAAIANPSNEAARIACLHRFAGHELLAVEMIAFALLAWPAAPPSYRRSLAFHLREEQRHTRLYSDELKARGAPLGSMSLYRHFWAHLSSCYTLPQFIATLNLTLEQANLDFCPLYAHLFAQAGDQKGLAILDQILTDEIGHVQLGLHWTEKITGQRPLRWKDYCAALPSTLKPTRCAGFELYLPPREKARIPSCWTKALIEAGKHPKKKLPRSLMKTPGAKCAARSSSPPLSPSLRPPSSPQLSPPLYKPPALAAI